MNAMSSFSGFASLSKAYGSTYGHELKDKDIIPTVTSQMEVVTTSINKKVRVQMKGFNYFTINSIIFDMQEAVDTSVLDDCYLILTCLNLSYGGTITNERTNTIPMNLMRLLTLPYLTCNTTENKTRIEVNKNLFMYEDNFCGIKLFGDRFNDITLQLAYKPSLNNVTEKYEKYLNSIQFDIILKKISRMNYNKRSNRIEEIYYNNNKKYMKGLITTEIPFLKDFEVSIPLSVEISGYFLYSTAPLKRIKYRIPDVSPWNYNIMPNDNIIKHWSLTRKHIKVLYEILEDVLPHEIIYAIEQFCEPDYLYWFPFEEDKKWDAQETNVVKGKLSINCDFGNNYSVCKIHAYKREFYEVR